jgi:PAS domain S-box-containing protein
VPILSPAGEVLGTIGTFFRENRGPTERERGVVQVLARTAALAIERRAAEEGARRDRERAELVVRGANVGVWYCTLPFDRLVWDEKVKEHFHLPPDAEVTIGTFYERIHPEDRERTRAAIADSVERRAPYDIDYRTVSPDGASVKWVRAMGRAYYDDAGRLVRFDGVTLDVTERRAAEDALRDSAESLRRHVDALAALNTINLTLASSDDTAAIVQTATDVATRLTRAAFGAFFYNVLNERGESYMLYTLSGVPRSAFERFPMPRNTHVFAPTFNGEGVVRSDDITKDPRYGRNPPHRGMPEGHLPVRSYLAVPVHSRDGGVIGGLFFGHPGTGVFDEEAERHAVGVAAQAAVALDNARLYTDLRRSEERYKLAARATSDAIWDWDLATGRIGWNQAVAQLFGHADAPAGTTAAWRLERVHPDDLGRVAEGLRAAADGEGGDAWSAEYRFQRADGSWADVFDRGTVLRDAGGKPLRMVGAMLDLSDRKRAERERQDLLESERAARAAAERAGRLKDEFLAVLSHELRTPLNAILGWTHLLRKGAADPEKVARGVEVIERNARAQSQLIADLLDVSRITAGKLRLDARAVDLPAVVGAAVEAVRPAADANGVLVHTELGAVGGEVRGDAARLQQVVWNLVSNAVKFTPRGGRVDVALGGAGGSAVVRVSDTGRGIAPEFLPFVFERFRQADSSAAREHGGLGLGLALVRQLVEMHGGRVAAASAGPGLGATFTVELPLAQAPAPDAGRSPEPEGAGDAGALALRLEGLRVLVVDDEPDALDVVRRVLEEHGVEAVAATSAEQGLAALEGGRFDALVSDIGMPGQDGYAFIAEARRRGVRAPAAALTAFARSEDRTRALLAGYQAHVTKPVEAAELLATVASLAGRTA